jgi:uncharacterized membrane protein YkvA (DUF1232 family)
MTQDDEVFETTDDDDFELMPKEPISETRANRFYDRIRRSIHDFIARRGTTVGKAGDYLLLVPDVFMLLVRLARDSRVSGKNKMLLGTGIAYYIFPLDVIPEALLGPMGWMDDLLFGVYILSRLLLDTDVAVLREHWSGREDLLAMIRRVIGAADQMGVPSKFVNRVKKMTR